MKIPEKLLKKKIMANIEKKKSGCWEWTRAKVLYGTLWDGEKMQPVHRLSYELFKSKKKVPKGRVVMHSCDNPPCVNPKHLKEGTNQENMIDARRRRTVWQVRPYFRNPLKGHTTKLNWNKVDEIRKIFSSGEFGYKELGDRFGVAGFTIKLIVTNKTWKFRDKEEWLRRNKA